MMQNENWPVPGGGQQIPGSRAWTGHYLKNCVRLSHQNTQIPMASWWSEMAVLSVRSTFHGFGPDVPVHGIGD